MKVLVFSDLHASRTKAAALAEASAGAELVIGAGDFCNMRQGLAEAMALLADVTCQMVLVPGNAESADELRAAAPRNATVLHGETASVGGLTLLGIGYGIPVTPFGDWSCDLTEAFAADMLAPFDAADVLISHSPPKGHCDLTGTGVSVGSTAIRDAVARIRPRFCLCGHIHDSWGRSSRIGGTTVLNLGPSPRFLDL